MQRVLFVCLGNICRSPTAEAVMRGLVAERGLDSQVEVDSAGTGSWHIGNPPDHRATEAAASRGVELGGAARQVSQADLEAFDWVIAMDRENLEDLRALRTGAEGEAEPALLRSFDPDAVAAGDLDVPDPYYGGSEGFEIVLDVVERGCDGLLAEIESELEG
jgi:protein-tyrosine phosphatase